MNENEITFLIRGSIFSVYNGIGPGLFESCYEAALEYELLIEGLFVEEKEV